MKIKYIIGVLVAITAFYSCTKEFAQENETDKLYTLTATVEDTHQGTKVGFDLENDAAFFWNNGDAIAVGSESMSKFTTTDVTGSKSATFTGPSVPSGYAIYPFSRAGKISGTSVTYNFSSIYNYENVDTDFFNGMSVDIPMWAKVDGSNLAFKHLGGVIAFKFPNLKAGDDQTFTMTANKKISGSFEADLNAENPELKATDPVEENDNKVSITFSLKTDSDAVFYVPVPVGTYAFDITLKNGENEYTNSWTGLTVNRRSIRYTTVSSHTLQGGEATTVNTADELKAALANEDIKTIVLAQDMTFSEILTIERSVTIDGNGKKLTSTAGRAINVSGADGVTIKNLTIEASGERAVNIIQNATNVTIDKITATAANYTVNVALSAPAAKVTISNSTLTGLNVVNVASPEAVVEVTGCTINCNDNNETKGESYAALCLNKDAIGGQIIATGCTINITEGSDSEKGRNGAENGIVTIDGSTEGVSVKVAAITFEGNVYYYSFNTLAEAIEFAETGSTITLIRNIDLSDEEWTPAGTVDAPFKSNFDGNGKTISGLNIKSGNFAGLFGYISDATIKNVTLSEVNVSGGERVAALIGKITGDAVVENCTVSGSVTGSESNTGGVIGEIVNGTVELKNLTNEASVTNTKESNSRAGGIVAQVTTNAKVKLINCVNNGAVTTVNGYAGGIVSAFQSGSLTIDNCVNNGELTGQYKGNMLGWYTSVRSISISTDTNQFDINAIGCVDIEISSNMSLYGRNYFVNRKADLTGVSQTKQNFSEIFAENQIGVSPKALWDKLIAFYSHAAETNVNFAGYPKTYWAMFNHLAGYPTDGAWNSYFNSYNANAEESQKLTKEEFSSASWREKIVYLAPEE